MDVPDIGQDLALAIADYQYSKGSYIFDIYIQNNTPDPIVLLQRNNCIQGIMLPGPELPVSLTTCVRSYEGISLSPDPLSACLPTFSYGQLSTNYFLTYL